jgi:hypothetical protein
MPRSGYEPTNCLVTSLNNVTIEMCMITEECKVVELKIILLELNKFMGKILTVSAWFSLSSLGAWLTGHHPVFRLQALCLCCSENAEEDFDLPLCLVAQEGSRSALALLEPAADSMYVLLLKWRRENCNSHHKTLSRDGELWGRNTGN